LNEEIYMKKNCFFCKVSRDITGTGLKRLAENENFILIRKNHCKKGLQLIFIPKKPDFDFKKISSEENPNMSKEEKNIKKEFKELMEEAVIYINNSLSPKCHIYQDAGTCECDKGRKMKVTVEGKQVEKLFHVAIILYITVL